MKHTKENKIVAAIIAFGIVAIVLIVLFVPQKRENDEVAEQNQPLYARIPALSGFVPRETLPVVNLPTPSIERMKKEGCVADGLLSGYGRTSKDVKVVNRSNCYYLHRAVETWLEAPDFDEVREIKARITKPDIVFGMFIAEAIDTKEKYLFREENRPFDFSDMCRKSSKNFWGEHTCKPAFERSEYRAYLKQITQEAMDNGIQVFMFGQVFFQDETDLTKSHVPDIIHEMRTYANTIGLDIVVGAQTNNIQDEKYLRHFDFIENGVGLGTDGSVEEGPCFSRYYQRPGDWCWALMWHPNFKDKADNVFVHFDWSGRIGDDMSTFARMNEQLRHKTLRSLHAFFTDQDIGFLLPVLSPLPKDNGGCYGPKKRFYSPNEKYGCDDEDVINDIIEEAREES